MSHVVLKVVHGLDGKVYVRCKVKIPMNVPHVPGSGYLPSVVLKRIILESKTPLEKNLDAKIVTVKEIGWDQPNPSPVKPSSASSSIIRTITVQPTIRQTHYPSFLPYVLVGLCLLAGLIVIVAFY
ncbi:hypothetical protein pdam_00015545, partial [Pocillopora damicornis]